jgi:hypothetical protein
MDDLSKIIAENGCVYVDNSVTADYIFSIVVQEDTVFTTLKENTYPSLGTPEDVMTAMNLTGKTLKAGAILTPYKDVFSDITLASGSVIVYKLGK